MARRAGENQGEAPVAPGAGHQEAVTLARAETPSYCQGADSWPRGTISTAQNGWPTIALVPNRDNGDSSSGGLGYKKKRRSGTLDSFVKASTLRASDIARLQVPVSAPFSIVLI
jgi:hypothetical protein